MFSNRFAFPNWLNVEFESVRKSGTPVSSEKRNVRKSGTFGKAERSEKRNEKMER